MKNFIILKFYPKVYLKLLSGAINNKNDINSTIENTIDIETIGGCCPSENLIIVLYIGPNTFSQFEKTLKTISSTSIDGVNYTNCVSISWGTAESNFGITILQNINKQMSSLNLKNINICVATGENGSSDGTPGNNVDFPSSSPYCTAVGGTSLICVPVNGIYNYSNPNTKEIAWTGSGGGISSFFSKPSYQSSITSNYRSTPDISLNADPKSGMYYLIGNKLQIIGGTSCSAPMFAGFLAATNTRVFVNPILYKTNGWCNDIVFGNNGAYSAINGYDNCTGFGSINGQILNSILLQKPIRIILNSVTNILYSKSPNNSIQIKSTIDNNENSQSLLWSSSNNSVATVDNSGIVTGLSIGNVSITATSPINNISNSLNFNVYSHIDVFPSKSNVSILKKPNTILITATLGNNESAKNIIWDSNNIKYASISSQNVLLNVSSVVVTYYNIGIGKTVIITAKNTNNNTNSSCSINISK